MTKEEMLRPIEQAIHKFQTQPLKEASTNLLDILGYRSDRTLELINKDREGFKIAMKSNSAWNQFKEDKAKFASWIGCSFIFQLTDEEINKSQQMEIFEPSGFNASNIKSYLFFAVELMNGHYTRTQFSEITREINKLFPMPVMAFFKQNDLLTISIINRRSHKKNKEKQVLEKVTLIKDIRINDPHRAHKEILCDLSLDSLKNKFKIEGFDGLHKAWSQTLNISLINQKFYKELKDWYLFAVKSVKFPQIRPAEDMIDDHTHQSESVIRLLTRLMFCWFLKEKQELIKHKLFDRNALEQEIEGFFSNDGKSTTYYKAILQNLFFATLSVPVNERDFISESFHGHNKQHGNQYAYRYQELFKEPSHIKNLFESVPFLNGGLFESLDIIDFEPKIRLDGFSDVKKNQPEVPDFLFWGENKNVDLSQEYDDKKKKTCTVMGIFEILNAYKFTIEENTPIEEEIALDPELLGQVFENLLAYYNPETHETARKQTASFYTPREIVNYMVDASLKSYLHDVLKEKTQLTEDEIETNLFFLLEYSEKEHLFKPDEVNILIDAIDHIKILDPACGSGAYPMGILHKLVHILSVLDKHNTKWQEQQIQKARQISDPSIKTHTLQKIEHDFANNEMNYGRKLYLIQNCIYGIDIQTIAIQISKLRFFISLLVDQKIAQDKENYGLLPLPNLEFKFVAANTLIHAPHTYNASKDEYTLQFQDPFTQELENLTADYFSQYDIKEKKTTYEKIEKLVEEKILQKLKEINSLMKQINDERFSEKYKKDKKELIEKMQFELALWKSYGNLFKHESVGFFETEYFFPRIGDGFDIVLGNPPYIQIQKYSGKPEQKAWERQGYQTFTKTGDIYCLFYEKGIELLKDNGSLCYITSNKWMRNGYGDQLRNFLYLLDPKLLIDLGSGVFDKATVDTNILQISKQNNKHHMMALEINGVSNLDEEFSIYVANHLRPQMINERDIWFIANQIELNLKDKIEKIGKPLQEWDVNINRGIVTGLNEAFIIDKTTREKLVKEALRNSEIIKPLLSGRDIQRYHTNWTGQFLIITGYNLNIPLKYPSIYKHLIKHQTKAKKRKDQGENWWNLRACSYYNEFSKEKIVWAETLRIYEDGTINYPRFAFVQPGYYLDKTTFFITGDHKHYIIAVLNSSLAGYLIDRYYCNKLGELSRGLQWNLLQNFPIAPVKNENEIMELVNMITQKKLVNQNTENEENTINQIVYQLYDLTEDEIAIIEKGVGGR
jgi:adenine-specific DNA-methyltransferase